MRIHCIPNRKELKEYLEVAAEYGAAFEYNDFFMPDLLDDPKECKKVIQMYKECDRDRSQDTLHGAFFDIHIHSQDRKIRQVCDERIHQSMDIAMELGARAVIFHTNNIPELCDPGYQNFWLNKNVEYWTKLLKEYRDLEVYIENMFDNDTELIVKLASQMTHQSRFGICLDVAHAYISSTPLEVWFEQAAPYIKHLHFNDNDKKNDSHEPVGYGTMSWEMVNHLIHKYTKEPSVLIEVTGMMKLKQSLKFMQMHSIYPF